ncbi:MAG: deacylase [Alphaproteobacteria bacterium]|nr:deacylase [Alphaproteobacteria bacterium]
MASRTRAWTRIDFDRDGKQVGTFNFNHSVHRSAYGVVQVPLAVIKHGRGPTVLLMAGNHGDEYEGQLALTRLIRTLDPGRVQGRLILLPMANAPAAKAGTRTSPLDGGNLNRVFPGDPGGTPTEQIAFFIGDVLMPLADVCCDLHSGGSSLEYLPAVMVQVVGDPEKDRRAMAAGRAFGYSFTVILPWGGPSGKAMDAAAGRGIIWVGGEFGGEGRVTPAYVGLLDDGIAGLLDHLDVVKDPKPRSATPTRLVTAGGPERIVYAAEAGVMEPVAKLGADVKPGDVAAIMHCPEIPDREPVTYRFEAPGVVLARRAMGRVEPGDCLYETFVDYVGPLA